MHHIHNVANKPVKVRDENGTVHTFQPGINNLNEGSELLVRRLQGSPFLKVVEVLNDSFAPNQPQAITEDLTDVPAGEDLSEAGTDEAPKKKRGKKAPQE